MELMISAGLQFHEALRMMAVQEDNEKFSEALEQVVYDIERGSSLEHAMAQHGETFSKFEMFTLRAGFQSGRIHAVLGSLAEAFAKRFQLISKVKSKVTYPAFLFVLCLNIAIFLPPFLFGKLFDLARSAGQELPWISRVVGSFSDFVRSPACIVVLFVIVAFLVYAWNNKQLRETLSSEAILWPGVGPVMVDMATINFCRAWILMQEAGLPLQSSLPRAASVAGNSTFSARIDEVCKEINAGVELSEAFMNTGLFSEFFVAALTVGVETGQLAHVLRTICDLKEEILEYRLDSMTALLEPLIMVMLGGVTGLVAVAAILPIAQMINNLA